MCQDPKFLRGADGWAQGQRAALPTEGPSPEQPTKIGTGSSSQSDVELMRLTPRPPLSIGGSPGSGCSLSPARNGAQPTCCSTPAMGAGVLQLGWHSSVSTLSGSGLWSLWKLAGLQLLWPPQRHLSGVGGEACRDSCCRQDCVPPVDGLTLDRSDPVEGELWGGLRGWAPAAP